MTITAPQPVETSTQSPLGVAVPATRHPFQPSPLNRRRWQNFKANRRGYVAFWIFMVLFVVTLFAVPRSGIRAATRLVAGLIRTSSDW